MLKHLLFLLHLLQRTINSQQERCGYWKDSVIVTHLHSKGSKDAKQKIGWRKWRWFFKWWGVLQRSCYWQNFLCRMRHRSDGSLWVVLMPETRCRLVMMFSWWSLTRNISQMQPGIRRRLNFSNLFRGRWRKNITRPSSHSSHYAPQVINTQRERAKVRKFQEGLAHIFRIGWFLWWLRILQLLCKEH